MDDAGRRSSRPRWPRSAKVTAGVLAGALVVLGVVLVDLAPGSPTGTIAAPTSSSAPTITRTGRVASGDVAASAIPALTIGSEQAMVGTLFPNGLSHNHSCTATVIASGSGDTVLTAAHCISGSARGWLFVPGYDKGSAPEGVWTVTGQYVTKRWLTDQASPDDFAVLTVADRTVGGRSATLASVTGAAQLSTTPAAGTTIRVIGYNAGRNDAATTCAVPMRLNHDHPTFYCHGFVGGSSGSPWLLANTGVPTVVGVIGGRHQGGCTEYTSHSAVFTSAVSALVLRASGNGATDDVPSAGSDNCATT